MSVFGKLKATATAKAGAVEIVKAPAVETTATIDGDYMVIRVPLTIPASQLRMSKPNEKTKVELPFITLMARLPESLPVTVVEGDERVTLYTRANYALNVLFSYSPQKGKANEDDTVIEPA